MSFGAQPQVERTHLCGRQHEPHIEEEKGGLTELRVLRQTRRKYGITRRKAEAGLFSR